MSEGKYTLAQLSELTELPQRKVRYYMHRNLVPPSDAKGKGRFGDEQLAALLAVKALRDAGLSLKTIADYLGVGDDDTEKHKAPGAGVIAEIVAALKASAGRLQPAWLRDVTDSILGVGPTLFAKVFDALRPRSASPRYADFASPASGLGPHAESQVDQMPRSTWERIPITSQLELHVKRPLSRSQNRALAQLIERAQELFSTEDG